MAVIAGELPLRVAAAGAFFFHTFIAFWQDSRRFQVGYRQTNGKYNLLYHINLSKINLLRTKTSEKMLEMRG